MVFREGFWSKIAKPMKIRKGDGGNGGRIGINLNGTASGIAAATAAVAAVALQFEKPNPLIENFVQSEQKRDELVWCSRVVRER